MSRVETYYAEAVLDGHVDRFCDLLADRILEEATRVDPEAHGQIEAAIWNNNLWLSGAVLARSPFLRSTREIVGELWSEIGIRNPFAELQIADHIDRYVGDPRPRRERVHDQCIAIGWAGYDEKTGFHPPEHFLALHFKAALDRASRAGGDARLGPDGKLLVYTQEEGDDWRLTRVLVSIQHPHHLSLGAVRRQVDQWLESAYAELQASDPRWSRSWSEIERDINPGGEFITGSNFCDNGQTNRKLVMDYHGPRVPIGGGAQHGKDSAHIDVVAWRSARACAVDSVRNGELTVHLTVHSTPGKALGGIMD